MAEYQLEPREETPELIDFDEAELRAPEEPGAPVVLRVRGEAPCFNMVVRLVPLVYIRQPEYWVVHVIGELQGGVCLEAIRPYDVILSPAPLGTQGVVVVGRDKRQQLENP